MRKRRRNPIHAYKRLLAADHDWDYAYLAALEKKKFERMRDYFERECHLIDNRFILRDLSICIRLIDIFMEEDAVHRTWQDRSFSGNIPFKKKDDGFYEMIDVDKRPIADYPVYVNSRNEKRFFRCTPIKDAQLADNRDRAIYAIRSLRQMKALHLYHLIREYKLFTWWD